MTAKVYVRIDDRYSSLGECLLQKLEIVNSKKVGVTYSRSTSTFELSRSGNCNFEIKCFHSENCPLMKLYDEFGLSLQIPKKIPVLCSIILVTEDQKVLMIRQNEHMSLMPKSWGYIYRKVQMKESICKAGLRGLREDTGINIMECANSYRYNDMDIQITPICAYESVFPKDCELGLPRNQGLIMFYSAKIPLIADEIRVKISEADCLVWVSKSEWHKIQTGEKVYLHSVDKEFKIDSKCLRGISPNVFSEGVSEGHLLATQLIFESL